MDSSWDFRLFHVVSDTDPSDRQFSRPVLVYTKVKVYLQFDNFVGLPDLNKIQWMGAWEVVSDYQQFWIYVEVPFSEVHASLSQEPTLECGISGHCF